MLGLNPRFMIALKKTGFAKRMYKLHGFIKEMEQIVGVFKAQGALAAPFFMWDLEFGDRSVGIFGLRRTGVAWVGRIWDQGLGRKSSGIWISDGYVEA